MLHYYRDQTLFFFQRGLITELLNIASKGRSKGKGKADPLQAWTGPEGSRKLRFPDFVTTAQDGGKVVSLTHRPHFAPRKYSWYPFLLRG